MPARKIVDEQEVIKWFEEGRTYAWMIEEYRRKYEIETVPSMWGNFRRRRGLDRRIQRDDELIPWAVKREHRWARIVMLLRAEARRRAGMSQPEETVAEVGRWTSMLHGEKSVVHYDPDTEDGFFLVPREPQDTDIIRRPGSKTTKRRNADRD